jgi:two-component system, NarL family, invasion response regulator UvrY
MSILVADDHEVVRRGLKDILADEFDKVRIGEARDSKETLTLVAERKWDLILLDIVMPGPDIVEVISEIRKRQPDVPILILTAVSELEYAVNTIKAGANGYITKQYASDELLLAIKKVLAGETYLSGETVKELAATLRGGEEKQHQKLSPRELEIFCLIAKGESVKEIAADLNCSDKTVSTHLSRIKEKTGLSSYVEITRYALQNRLVE